MSRYLTFSSSNIHRLVGPGSRKMTAIEKIDWLKDNPKSKAQNIKHLDTPDGKFDTYVKEKVRERNLGVALNSDRNARPTSWGHLVEKFVFDEKMGLDYTLVSKKRYYHKKHKEYWSGMPDLITPELVADIKCHWTRTAFCDLVESIESVELFKENHPEYYWQLVSNAILCDRDKAMIISYIPYFEDLEGIRLEAEARSGEIEYDFSFVQFAKDEELPYLIEGNKYNDINILEFDIPQEDKDILTARIEMAIVELKKQLN